MKEVLTITPQATLKRVAANLGLKTLPKMQGTTRAVFDTVGVSSSMTFFEGVGARPFPASNVNQNKFEVNSALAVQAIVFSLANSAGDPAIPASLNTIPLTGYWSFDLVIGNQTVLKNVPFSVASSAVTGKTYGANNKIWLTSPIVIPPQVSYKVIVNSSGSAPAPNVSCFLYGTGVLFNPKSSL